MLTLCNISSFYDNVVDLDYRLNVYMDRVQISPDLLKTVILRKLKRKLKKICRNPYTEGTVMAVIFICAILKGSFSSAVGRDDVHRIC